MTSHVFSTYLGIDWISFYLLSYNHLPPPDHSFGVIYRLPSPTNSKTKAVESWKKSASNGKNVTFWEPIKINLWKQKLKLSFVKNIVPLFKLSQSEFFAEDELYWTKERKKGKKRKKRNFLNKIFFNWCLFNICNFFADIIWRSRKLVVLQLKWKIRTISLFVFFSLSPSFSVSLSLSHS